MGYTTAAQTNRYEKWRMRRMRNLGNKMMFGAGVALALAIGSQQANADVIFVESFEGTLQSETSIYHGGIRKVGDFFTVVEPSTLVDINYDVGDIHGTSTLAAEISADRSPAVLPAPWSSRTSTSACTKTYS